MELTVTAKKDELVERCKNGDTLACRQLYQQYVRAMYNTCRRILNNDAAAEDVLQESFIEAFKNLPAFAYRTSFGGWLKQICINRCINELKKKKTAWVDIDATPVYEQAEENDVEEDSIQLKVETVKKAILQLPDGYRTVLSLYLLEGYDHEEIATILNVAESTTRSQYIRAKQKLIQIVKKEYEQAGKIY